MKDAQVIIVGAGPSGVVAAYALAQRGIKVLLCETEAECPEDMRASTFHPPTLEMMAELGLLEALEAQGLKAPVYNYRNRATGEVLAFDLTEIADATPYPYRLQCEQWKLTRLVTGLLEDHPNCEVKFRRKLLSFEQDVEGVTVHFEAPLAIEHYRADYLLGTDGANSIVRKWLDIEFEGFTYPEKFLTLSTDYPLEDHFEDLARVSYVADQNEWCVLLRVPTLWRVLVPADEGESDIDLRSDTKKNAVFDGLLGKGMGEQITTYHRTVYRVHQRVAKTYRSGRAVLAGDAAHLNNPLGGFGMNSGVHDVWNLVPKLVAILQDGAEAEPLLDLYERQRRTIMNEFVQAQTIRNKANMQVSDAEAQARNQAEMAKVLADPQLRREYLLRQSMLTSRVREAQIQ
ncbi:MAG: FAD-dependent oxidoreductase [Janthinobacterium lividum]